MLQNDGLLPNQHSPIMTIITKILTSLIAISICASLQAHISDSSNNIDNLLVQAERGDARAQMLLGKSLYEDNQREQGAKWIRLSAKQNYPEAVFWMGYAMLGDKPANYYYEQAAELGYAEAFGYCLDHTLFRAANNADITKAKYFADLARSFNLEGKLFRELSTVDECFGAGVPPQQCHNNFYSGSVCHEYDKNTKAYAECIFEQGNNIDASELYANGYGVAQNFKTALAYACHGADVPAELTAMVKTLARAHKNGQLDEPFSFCQHVTSSNAAAVCYQQSESEKFQLREEKIKALIKKWAPKSQDLFEELRAAAHQYFDTRSRNEQDLTGSFRSLFITEMYYDQLNAFFDAIYQLESNTLESPKHSLQELQQQFDNTLQKLLKQKETETRLSADICGQSQIGSCEPYITKEGIEDTQAAWHVFSDTFQKFYVGHYPDRSVELITAWLLQQRLSELQGNAKIT